MAVGHALAIHFAGMIDPRALQRINILTIDLTQRRESGARGIASIELPLLAPAVKGSKQKKKHRGCHNLHCDVCSVTKTDFECTAVPLRTIVMHLEQVPRPPEVRVRLNRRATFP